VADIRQRLTRGQLGKVLGDAMFEVWNFHNRVFPDFNTMGREMEPIITKRLKRLRSDTKLCKGYFKEDSCSERVYGGMNLNKVSENNRK